MDTSKPIIICGSGNSIPFLNSQYYRTGCGLPLELEQIIKYNYSIGLNYWFQFGCETTFNCSGDWQFYVDNSEELKKLAMIIASDDPSLKNKNIDRTHDNTILLPHAGLYFGKEDSWKNGFYHRQSIGIFTLTLAIALGFEEIYLLGYDCKEINGQTHFYQGVADLNKATELSLYGVKKADRYHFRGVGKKSDGSYKTSTYDSVKQINNKWFAPFHLHERKRIKIYNVSLDSVINTFPKISYEQFYSQIKNNHIDQNEAREDIKKFALEKLHK